MERGRLAGWPGPGFTASPNLQPSAIRPQHHLCVRSKEKSWCEVKAATGLASVVLTERALLFDLFSVIIARPVHVLYCSPFLFPPLPSLLLFSLRLFLPFALWDLVPACLTSLTMKQMQMLIILLAAISL